MTVYEVFIVMLRLSLILIFSVVDAPYSRLSTRIKDKS